MEMGRRSVPSAGGSFRKRNPAPVRTGDNARVGILMRIGSAPGVRRLVRRSEQAAEVRENGDDGEAEPTWCSDCWREVLFGLRRCPDCGGTPVTALELAHRRGDVSAAGRTRPASVRLASPHPPTAADNDRVPDATA